MYYKIVYNLFVVYLICRPILMLTQKLYHRIKEISKRWKETINSITTAKTSRSKSVTSSMTISVSDPDPDPYQNEMDPKR